MNVRKIRTERLEIIPFERKHITARYIDWLNDPDVVRYSNQRFMIHTKKTCEEYLATYDNNPDFYWAIVEIQEGHGHIGNINAIMDKEPQVADLGIVIGEKQLWGKGYGLEAWLLVCDYFFSTTSVLKITGGTPVTNKAMISIFRKAGMQEQLPEIAQDMVAGELIDVIKFELIRQAT